MIDWLRQETREPTVTIGGREVPLAIRRHPRATRLIMRLAPDGSEVRVTLPRWGRSSDAMIFASKRVDWLEQQLAAVPRAIPPAPGGTVRYCGHALQIAWEPDCPRKPALDGERLVMGGPAETVPTRVRRWLEAEAVRLLRDDLAFYCSRAGVAESHLRLSRATRRWGSCSGPGKGGTCIRINWRLVQAPDDVRRSVVAHEVAHLVHFDHSPAFRALLASLFDGDLNAADLWLKREGRSLYTTFG